MDAISSAFDRLKAFAYDLVNGRDSFSRRNPIEILKRLQREVFSDLMKLRDRQDKIERILSFYKTTKANPFEESSTHVRGEVDLLGAMMLMWNVDDEPWDGVVRAGIRTGVGSRFRFETTVRDKDYVGVEFVANQKTRDTTNDNINNNTNSYNNGDVYGTPLSLSKLFYKANAGDWFSAISVPFGAQFKDFDVTSNFSLQEEKGLTDLSLGPPLLHQPNGNAVGVAVRTPYILASLVQSVAGLRDEHCLSTFGQVVCQLPTGLRLSFLGLHRGPKLASLNARLGALVIPFGFRRQIEDGDGDTMVEATSPGRSTQQTGAIALKLESELGEYKRFEGWVEMKQASQNNLQWAVSLYDTSEDVFGCGMSLGGIVEGPSSWDHFQIESYVKLNLSKRFSLKPGVAYVVDGNSRTLALVLRSNWFL